MSEFEIVDDEMKAHCPECDKETNCNLKGFVDQPWELNDGSNYIAGQIQHRLLQCAGCDKVFYHKTEWDTENWDEEYDPKDGKIKMVYATKTETFPEPSKEVDRPAWSWKLYEKDHALQEIMTESYLAAERGSLVLASMGLRTAFDRATDILGIDPGASLVDKLRFLKDKGLIGNLEHSALDAVVDAGSAAAHRGWRPSFEGFAVMKTAIELFIHRTIVIGDAAQQLGKSVPPRQKRSPPSSQAKPDK